MAACTPGYYLASLLPENPLAAGTYTGYYLASLLPENPPAADTYIDVCIAAVTNT